MLDSVPTIIGIVSILELESEVLLMASEGCFYMDIVFFYNCTTTQKKRAREAFIQHSRILLNMSTFWGLQSIP